MSRHIGVVGITYPGALLCVQAICEEAPGLTGEDRCPEVTLQCSPAADYLKAIALGDWLAVADQMVQSARKLESAGADFAISPANTAHEVFDAVVERSPIPWISIVEATADEAIRNGYRRVGVMGTRPLVERRFYRETLKRRGLDVRYPEPSACAEMHRLIVAELVRNVFTEGARTFFRDTALALRSGGCDAVIMACTEIPLLLSQDEVDVPLLDSTRILARAALVEALR